MYVIKKGQATEPLARNGSLCLGFITEILPLGDTGNVMQTVIVRLAISAERFQAYYRGVVEDLVAQATDGRFIQFPARVLRPFFSYQGIHGTFEITFDANMKFHSIRRTGERN